MRWFVRRIDTEEYRESVMETLFAFTIRRLWRTESRDQFTSN